MSMPTKIIYRYEHRAYQDGHVETLRTEEFRLSRLTPARTALTGNQAGRWCLTWLAERWIIDFPQGLHRHRGGEPSRYRVGFSQTALTLAQVINMARYKADCDILLYKRFPDPEAVSRAHAVLQEEREEQ